MITVECGDVEAIMHDLAVYVADQLGAIPAMQLHKFALSPLDDSEALDMAEAVTAIREYIDSIGEARGLSVIARGNTVTIHSLTGRPVEGRGGPRDHMFACPHCGFVTKYETEYNVHKRIHYL